MRERAEDRRRNEAGRPDDEDRRGGAHVFTASRAFTASRRAARQGVVDEAGQPLDDPRYKAATGEASQHEGGQDAKAGRAKGQDAQV